MKWLISLLLGVFGLMHAAQPEARAKKYSQSMSIQGGVLYKHSEKGSWRFKEHNGEKWILNKDESLCMSMFNDKGFAVGLNSQDQFIGWSEDYSLGPVNREVFIDQVSEKYNKDRGQVENRVNHYQQNCDRVRGIFEQNGAK